MTQAQIAKMLDAVTLGAPTLKEQFQRHVKVTWLSYIVQNAKKNRAQIMPAPAMVLIIKFLDDSQTEFLFPRLELLAEQLIAEPAQRGWVDDINPKYTACLLQVAFARTTDPFFHKLKVPIQRRLWVKKDFTSKLLRVPTKQQKNFTEAKSYAEYMSKQQKVKAVKYGNKNTMQLVYVSIFDVYVRPDFPRLGADLQRYKTILRERGGRESPEALSIRKAFLQESGIELKPHKSAMMFE